MIGILGPSLEDLWQQRLVAQAGRALLACDYYPLILDPGGDAERQRLLAAQLRDQQVDGMIVSPVDPADPFWAELTAALPVVSIGDGLPGGHAVGEVLFDNRSGVRCALEHLAGLGHRRIAVLCPPGAPTADRPAERAVAAEAARLDLDVRTANSPFELASACAVASRLLSADPAPTAVFCLSDSLAHGACAAARELQLPIPGSLSVVGYDDHPVSALLFTPLTTFTWEVDRLVEVAVRMLLDSLQESTVTQRVVFEPRLRTRSSTGPPPASAPPLWLRPETGGGADARASADSGT